MHGIGRPRPAEDPLYGGVGSHRVYVSRKRKKAGRETATALGTGKSCGGMDPPWTPRLTIPQRPLREYLPARVSAELRDWQQSTGGGQRDGEDVGHKGLNCASPGHGET